MSPPRKKKFDVRESAGMIALALGGLLVANAVFAVLVLRPRAERYEKLDVDSVPQLKDVAERRRLVESDEAYFSALRKAQEDLKTLRQDVLSTREDRMIETQLELARLAREFGVDLEEVRYENEILKDEGIDRFGMVVPLKGGYRALRKFIQAVEASKSFLVIEKIVLDSGKNTGGPLDLKITLATYFDVPELFRESVRRKAAEKS